MGISPVSEGMTSRSGRIRTAVTVAAAIAVVLTMMSVSSRPTAGCGCSSFPDLRSAERTAARFTGLVRAGDSAGAWGLLTDGAQARYGDPARFRPVLERLATADREASGAWHFVSDPRDSDIPSDVVLTRYTGPHRLFAVVVVRTWRDRPDANRVDPEPAGRDVRVTDEGEAGLWVTGVDPHEDPRFVLVNPAGTSRDLESGRAPGGHRLTVPDDARSGRALLAVAVPSVSGWSVAAVPLVPGAGGDARDERRTPASGADTGQRIRNGG